MTAQQLRDNARQIRDHAASLFCERQVAVWLAIAKCYEARAELVEAAKAALEAA